MNFSVNSTFLYGLAVVGIIFVLAQSVFFLIRAYKRGAQMGITTQKLNKTIVATAVFTIAPALSILIGIITLSKFLGIPLPWIRMSVIGAITYELPAATSTAKAFGISKSTIHKDVTERLPRVNKNLAEATREVLDVNKSERHIRGGMATREKYLHKA